MRLFACHCCCSASPGHTRCSPPRPDALADDLDALVVHLRYPPRHRRRWRSTNLLEKVARRGQTGGPSDGPLPRRAKLPVARLGRPRPPDHPRDQRHPLQPTRPPTPHANQVPGRQPGHGRGGDSRGIRTTPVVLSVVEPSGAQPAAACAAIICSSSGIGWSAWGSWGLRAGSLVALTRSLKAARGKHEEHPGACVADLVAVLDIARAEDKVAGTRLDRFSPDLECHVTLEDPEGLVFLVMNMQRRFETRGVRHLHDRQVSAGVCPSGLDHGLGTWVPARLPFSTPDLKRVRHRRLLSLASSISRARSRTASCHRFRGTPMPASPTRVPQCHEGGC